MDAILQTYKRILAATPMAKKRYLFDQINWNNRLIGITGQRGTGKSTLLLQRIKSSDNPDAYLYVSADSLFIYRHTLFEIALSHRNMGGQYLFIDEVHRYPSWSAEIKHIYDTIPEINIVFTGSSILDIMKGYADLSRRAIHYVLSGLSFREYLFFETDAHLPSYSIEEIISQKIKLEIDKPLFHFKNYLQKGFFPFYTEDDYDLRLLSIVNTVLEVDLIQYLEFRPATIAKLKKLLQIISESVPFKPNIKKIAELTSISRALLFHYLQYLEKAGLILLVGASTKGIQGLSKPEKIYINNPNLCYAFGNQSTNIGNIRETFFANQLKQYTVTIPPKGDFKVNDYIFEIGGKHKTAKQIQGIANAFLVKDDIEFGTQKTIPLWHFGFLY